LGWKSQSLCHQRRKSGGGRPCPHPPYV